MAQTKTWYLNNKRWLPCTVLKKKKNFLVLDKGKLRSGKNYFLQSARVDQNWKHSNHKVHSLEHGSAVLCVSFNESKIVSGSADETIRGTSLPPQAFLPNPTYLIDKTFTVWDFKTRKCLHTL